MALSAGTPSKSRLGRGLASLIGDQPTEVSNLTQTHDDRAMPIEKIRPSTLNPRRNFDDAELDELASSIRERGLVQPIVVRPARLGSPGYEIIAGERRWRAAQRAGLHMVPVVIREASDQDLLEIAIIENVQRSDLNAMEEAQGYRELVERHGYTQEELSKIIGKSRSHLANTMRLLKLPDDVQDLVRAGRLSAGHARALIGREDASAVAQRIVAEGLNVRDVEALVYDDGLGEADAGDLGAGPGKARSKTKHPDIAAVESELGGALGLAVAVNQGSGEAGEVRIKYRTLEQFEDVRRRLLRR